MARTAELHRLGVSASELRRAIDEGRVLRPRQGVYALPDTPAELLHAAAHGGTVGCASAAALWGLWVLDVPPQVHVWMGSAGTPRSDCVSPALGGRKGAVGEPPPVTTVLLQLAQCADEETFFAALESSLRLMLLPPSGILMLRHRLPLQRRWLLGFARGDADSGLESNPPTAAAPRESLCVRKS